MSANDELRERVLKIPTSQCVRIYCSLEKPCATCRAFTERILPIIREREALAEAGAFLAAKRCADAEGVVSPEDGGTLSRWDSCNNVAKAIDALTPADAQAALDHKVAAAREAGEILGYSKGYDAAVAEYRREGRIP